MTAKPGRFAAYWEAQLGRIEQLEAKRAKKLPTWRTRKRRRQLVALVMVGDLLLIAGAAVLRAQEQWVFAVLWFGGCVLGGVPHHLLRILTGKMSSSFSRQLDEREREWRHRVTYVGYQTLAYLMIAGVIYLLVIAKQADSAYRGAIMITALLIGGATVPTGVLGWSLPDDDPEDFIAEGEAP
ncbi:hypothetical protein [Amycolatopsis sp. H20-H5]|uniref:hypothetical protein n=1 Tax=Amycolatopsis sp. H20-H5 TaxID=3046309 RepID=UPI002DB9A92B|nr:hypothetical protein [Amycolatopsis sp. H20-H5]MEC3979599.1 hypothetical protein [Amycolatopsis sp. H20-H5]